MSASWWTRWTVAPLLLALLATGCGGDDDSANADDESTPDSASGETSEVATSPAASEEPLDLEAQAEAITHCDQLLLTTKQVGDVLGIKVLKPKKDKAAGVVFGCEYASPNKSAGGGQLVVDASTTTLPPPDFTTPVSPVKGVGDEALFNPQPGATTILRVRSGETILDFSVGGVLLYEQFGGQEKMAAPLVELANLALANLDG
jgi:hypothetical protein